MYKINIEQKEIYVKDSKDYIYIIESFDISENSLQIGVNLQLVAGIDYIPEINKQDYVMADYFIKEVQTDFFNWLYMEESLKECITENGYTILKELPNIYIELIV